MSDINRSRPWFHVTGDRVWRFDEHTTTQEPYDESELGHRVASSLELERIGLTALDDSTCHNCHAITQSNAMWSCDNCRPSTIALIRERWAS